MKSLDASASTMPGSATCATAAHWETMRSLVQQDADAEPELARVRLLCSIATEEFSMGAYPRSAQQSSCGMSVNSVQGLSTTLSLATDVDRPWWALQCASLEVDECLQSLNLLCSLRAEEGTPTTGTRSSPIIPPQLQHHPKPQVDCPAGAMGDEPVKPSVTEHQSQAASPCPVAAVPLCSLDAIAVLCHADGPCRDSTATPTTDQRSMEASCRIQSVYRMHRCRQWLAEVSQAAREQHRRQFEEEAREDAACAKIQALYLRWKERRIFLAVLKERAQRPQPRDKVDTSHLQSPTLCQANHPPPENEQEKKASCQKELLQEDLTNLRMSSLRWALSLQDSLEGDLAADKDEAVQRMVQKARELRADVDRQRHAVITIGRWYRCCRASAPPPSQSPSWGLHTEEEKLELPFEVATSPSEGSAHVVMSPLAKEVPASTATPHPPQSVSEPSSSTSPVQRRLLEARFAAHQQAAVAIQAFFRALQSSQRAWDLRSASPNPTTGEPAHLLNDSERHSSLGIPALPSDGEAVAGPPATLDWIVANNLLPLQHLDHGAHPFGPCSALSLISALATNTTLETLALRRARVRNYHIDILCTALAGNTTLRSIMLDDNQITEKGALALIDHLKVHPTLQRITVEGNPIDADLKAQLLREQLHRQ
eukprot:GGOE01000438.1.p1 GENE.GGOE01000438.1~~GGOE01000438.1.p1  ORF type:complete len:655 (-),score=137.23 GGOE01000438.1:301-2265(-)